VVALRLDDLALAGGTGANGALLVLALGPLQPRLAFFLGRLQPVVVPELRIAPRLAEAIDVLLQLHGGVAPKRKPHCHRSAVAGYREQVTGDRRVCSLATVTCNQSPVTSHLLQPVLAQVMVVVGPGQQRAILRDGDAPDRAAGAEALDPVAVARAPELDRLVLARGGELAAVRREGDTAHGLAVRVHHAELPAGRYFPKPCGAIAATGGDQGAVRREGDRHRLTVVAGKRPQLLPCGGVPDLHRAVAAGGGEHGAIGREGNRPHPVLMARQGTQLLARGRIPELHVAVGAGRGDGAAVGREGNAEHILAVAGEGLQLPLRLAADPPDLHRRIAAGGSEQGAVRREGDAVDEITMTVQRRDRVATGRVPEPHGVIGARRGERPAIGREGDGVDDPAMALERGRTAGRAAKVAAEETADNRPKLQR